MNHECDLFTRFDSVSNTEQIEMFADWAGIELLVIDDDTTPRSFLRELRWNAAYHRLAEGIGR